jgi:hypothetical protein
MKIIVLFHEAFLEEFWSFPETVQDCILSRVALLENFGQNLGRPYANHLKGSKYANMKELRFDSEGGVWRLVFAFDPQRKAILLAAADKRGENQNRFYTSLIKKADKRFEIHLKSIKA